MSELFPFFDADIAEETENLPLYQEIAWDYVKNCPVIKNGEFVLVTGNEAIKSWCYRSLQTKRYGHEIYSWDYASELDNLIGINYSKSLIQAEAERYVKECLLINPYINSVTNISSEFQDGLLSISCELNTIYGQDKLQEVSVGV